MGVYLSGNDQLGFSLKKLQPGKLLAKAVKPVAKVAAVVGVPGASLVAKLPAPKKKPAPAAAPIQLVPPAPTEKVAPAGSTTVQVQRKMAQRTNRPGATPKPAPKRPPVKGGSTPAPTPLPAPALVSPAITAPLKQDTPKESKAGLSKLQQEVNKLKLAAKAGQKVTGGVSALRDKQRKFSDTARKAAGNAKTLKEKAEKMAAAGVPGAAEVAQQAQVAAQIATSAAQGADAAGAAVSAATTAGMAAGATGSEGAGVLTAGVVGFIKEKPLVAAGVGAALAFTAYKAFAPKRRSA